MKRIISPLLYALSVMPVILLVILSLNVGERVIGFHALFRKGDIDAGIAILFWGVIVFGFSAIRLYQFEHTKTPSFTDHARMTGLLYGAFLLVLSQFLYNDTSLHSGLYNAYQSILLSVLFVGIVANAIVSALKRREGVRSSSSGEK